MSEDFLEPSPQARRNIILLYLSALAVGCLVRFWILPQVLGHIQSLPMCDQLPWYRSLLLGVIFTPALAGIWMLFQARRLLISGQLPPPDTWVFRRTPIVRGASVRWRAYAGIALSLVVCASPVEGWRIVSGLPFFSPPKVCAPDKALQRIGLGLRLQRTTELVRWTSRQKA